MEKKKPVFPFDKKAADEKQNGKKKPANGKPLPPENKKAAGKKPVEKKAPTAKKKSCK